MNDNDIEVLGNLRGGEWLRPMDVGGTDGSHHNRTLSKLIKKGYAVRIKRNTITNVLVNGPRGSYRYRITEAGKAAYDDHKGK